MEMKKEKSGGVERKPLQFYKRIGVNLWAFKNLERVFLSTPPKLFLHLQNFFKFQKNPLTI